MVLSKKSNKKNSGKRSMQKTRKGGKKSKMTSKKTGKKGTKKGKGGKSGKKQFSKMSKKSKKGGELTMTDPPSPGDCVKKGTFGLHKYEVVEVRGSDGFGMPTILVKGSDGEYERHNLPDMVRCNLKTKM